MDPTEKLYRSRTNRQAAGVCGGLAERFNVDVILIRGLFILLGLLGGAGIVLYVAMWIIVPKEPPVGGAPWEPPPQALQHHNRLGPSATTSPVTGWMRDPAI